MEEAKVLVDKYFDKNKKQLWGVVYNCRNNENVQRDEIIDGIGKIVGENHTVNLKSPELTILVEVFKVNLILTKSNINLVCLCNSIVKDYYQLKKFNLQAMQQTKTEKETTTPTEASKEEENTQ